MRPTPAFAAISFSADAISNACARLSSAQGPAMIASGRLLPIFTEPTVTTGLGSAIVRPSGETTPSIPHRAAKLVDVAERADASERRQHVENVPESGRIYPDDVARADFEGIAGRHTLFGSLALVANINDARDGFAGIAARQRNGTRG